MKKITKLIRPEENRQIPSEIEQHKDCLPIEFGKYTEVKEIEDDDTFLQSSVKLKPGSHFIHSEKNIFRLQNGNIAIGNKANIIYNFNCDDNVEILSFKTRSGIINILRVNKKTLYPLYKLSSAIELPSNIIFQKAYKCYGFKEKTQIVIYSIKKQFGVLIISDYFILNPILHSNYNYLDIDIEFNPERKDVLSCKIDKEKYALHTIYGEFLDYYTLENPPKFFSCSMARYHYYLTDNSLYFSERRLSYKFPKIKNFKNYNVREKHFYILILECINSEFFVFDCMGNFIGGPYISIKNIDTDDRSNGRVILFSYTGVFSNNNAEYVSIERSPWYDNCNVDKITSLS